MTVAQLATGWLGAAAADNFLRSRGVHSCVTRGAMARNLLIVVVVAEVFFVSSGCDGQDEAAATIAFDLNSKLDSKTFWDLPFPSDLRLTAAGNIDLAGFPNDDKLLLVTDLLTSAADRKGFPVMPVAWFRFTDASTAPVLRLVDSVAAAASNPILLVDIDPTSPELGRLFPIVAELLPVDDYTAPALIAVAPAPMT